MIVCGKKKLFEGIETLLLVLLASANAFPYFLYLDCNKILYFAAYAMLLVISLIRNKMHKEIRADRIVRAFLVCWMFFIPFALGLQEYANRYLFLSGLMLYPIIYENVNKMAVRNAIKILALMAAATAIQTLMGLLKNPYASRAANDVKKWQQRGVGGYMYIYAVAIASVLLFAYIINHNMSRNNFFLILEFMIFSIVILKANFVTAILILCIGMLVAVLYKKMSIKIKFIWLFFGGIIFIFLLITMLQKTVSAFVAEGSRLSELFNENSSGIIRILLNEFLDDRFPTWMASINTIMKYPLFGALLQGNGMVIFGEHSTILDTIGLWGIPLGILYVYYIFKPFSGKIRKSPHYLMPLFCAFFVLALFNNVDCTSAFVFEFLGLFIYDIDKKKELQL